MNLDREFEFRGDRKYLQSASLFDDLIQLRGADASGIDFKFHRKTGNQVAYVDKRPADEDQLIAEWHDSQGDIFVVERDTPIVSASPYDEPALVRMFERNDRTLTIPADVSPFSRIESLVAGFKFLLQSVYPDIKRKYVFVRTRMKHLPEGDVSIRYARDIGAFFQGDIQSGDERIGQIFFGEWR